MYAIKAFPKMLTWLLAVAIAIQPISGFSCGCDAAKVRHDLRAIKRPSAWRVSVQRHDGGCRCCCWPDHSMTVNKPQGTDFQSRPSGAIARKGISTCRCGAGNSARSDSLPGQRGPTTDLATSVPCDHFVTADVPPVSEDGGAANLSPRFASASEYCIALRKLRF
jgi:hypothetical protein